MATQSTADVFNSHNKAIEATIIQECRDTPKKGIVITTINDDAYNNPIIELSPKQKATFKLLTIEI